MTIVCVPRGIGLIAATIAAIVGIATVHAQQPSGSSNAPPNALQGFSQNRDKPIKINSATLEVRDKEKMATFAGNVHLVQGDTSMRSKTLVVFYDDDAPSKSGAPSAGAAKAEPQQNQQIKRVEAKGDVLVVQKDQRATGESGIFDMRTNTVTLVGNVVISQGPNVVKGDTLTVDMTTGVSRITGGRVTGLFQPGSMKQEGHMPENAPAPAREAPRQRSSQPKGLSPQGLY